MATSSAMHKKFKDDFLSILLSRTTFIDNFAGDSVDRIITVILYEPLTEEGGRGSGHRFFRRQNVFFLVCILSPPLTYCRRGKCEYRKCDSSCEESSWDFDFEGETYERHRYCCDFDYCNGVHGALLSQTTVVFDFQKKISEAVIEEERVSVKTTTRPLCTNS